MPAPTYPNVPVTQGVPPVARDPSAPVTGSEPQLTKDADTVDRMAAAQWGIFTQDGANVLQPDNIVAVGYSSEFRTSDYPLEQGQFESFNKVTLPFQNRVSMTKGGPLSERQDFQFRLEAIRGDLILYNVVTPEQVYLNVNIEHVTIDRTAANGATLLTAEVSLREIRQTAVVKFTSSKTPSGAKTVSTGSVQTSTTPLSADSVK